VFVAVPTLTRRGRLAVLAAAGWGLVSLLPVWEKQIAVADAAGRRTEIYSVDVWRASTPAAAAVAVAAVVTVVLVLAPGRPPRTAEQRAAGLVATVAPVVLLGVAAWSVFRTSTGPHEWGFVVSFDAPTEPPDYHPLRDHLEVLSLPGYVEGPSWGVYLVVPLVLAAAAWATYRVLRPPASA
jgi:hypothetical protein